MAFRTKVFNHRREPCIKLEVSVGRSKEEDVWYSEGLAFECTQCGGCCSGNPGFVWVTPEEIARIATHMDMDIETFEMKFVRRVGNRKSLVEYPDGDCIFLDPKKRNCMVYESRPIQCRTWPFWESIVESKKSWAQTAKFCPGCNKGKVYTLEQIVDRKNAGSMHDL